MRDCTLDGRSAPGRGHAFRPCSRCRRDAATDLPRRRAWSRAQADIDRITEIWRECLNLYGGPYLLGERRSMADAMFAPVTTRFRTYHVTVDDVSQAYCDLILARPEMVEWDAAARAEPEDVEEL